MSTSPLLNFDYIQAAQNQKEVTANAMGDRIAQALCNYLSVAMTDADYTLTATGPTPQAYGNMMLNFTGTLTAGRNIIVPSTNKLYIVRNSTTGGFSLTVKAAAGTGAAIAAGDCKMVYFDGTNIIALTAGLGGVVSVFGRTGAVTAVSGDYTAAQITNAADQASVQDQAYSYAADTGAANAYVVTLAPVPTLVTGLQVIFKAVNANSGVSTVNVNALGVKTIKKLGGTTDLASGDIAAGQLVRVVYDGTNFQMQSQVGNASATVAQPYDMPIFLSGQPGNGATIFRCIFTRIVVFPAGMTGSRAVVGTNPTGSVTYTFKINGTSFATLGISSIGVITWTSASGATFNAGDVLTVVAPTPQDGTLADVGFTIVGTR